MACYDNFIGDISITPYTFAPKNYAYCDGSALSLSQNQVVFALLGTTFGGDGVKTFNLPDLRGRVPLGADGKTYLLGAMDGATTVTPVAVAAQKPGDDTKDSAKIQVASADALKTLPPYQTLSYVIAMYGVWPSRW